MRTAFIKQLTEEAKHNDKIFLVVGDLGFSVIEEFATLFPNRYINTGIAEQNMIGVSAGLAREGFNVYVYSIGNFPTQRCMEQIRYDVCYHELSVKIISVGGGYAYGSLGASHHATEEIGMLRTIPGIVICSPADPVEARKITSISANYDGAMYIRLGKAGEPIIHTDDLSHLTIGDIIPIKQSTSNIALLASGSILDYSVKFIKENEIDTSIYSLPFIKPLNKSQLIEIASKYKKIIIMEEHQKSGGVGSAILEQLCDIQYEGLIKYIPTIQRIAIDDKFYSLSGSQQYLRNIAGLTLKKSYFHI